MENKIGFLVIIRSIYLKQMVINSLKGRFSFSNVLIFLTVVFLAASCDMQDSSLKVIHPLSLPKS